MEIRPHRIIKRKKTRLINVGNVKVGGDSPISVQSMTNTLTTDIKQTINQIQALEEAGADIVRVSCPDQDSTLALKKIAKEVNAPIVADIHFHYKRAIEAAKMGASCLRINPGNIGNRERVIEVIKAAKDNNCSVRIGVNAGSLDKNLLEKYKEPCPEALVESANYNIKLFEDNDFFNFKISVKSSDIFLTVKAYKKLSEICDYPLHLGVTEAGSLFTGSIKSSIGIGQLLMDGIGDTIRVSLSSDPVDEVKAGYEILKSLGIRSRGVNIISCPSCARQAFPVIETVKVLEKKLAHIKKPINLSIIGCVVNGPGEAAQTEIGLTGGGQDNNLLYLSGVPHTKVPNSKIIDKIVQLVENKLKEKNWFMLPLQKVKEIVSKYNSLEKELSSGNIDPKQFANKSKEYANLGNIISTAKEYINFDNEKKDLEQILQDQSSDKEIIEMAQKDLENLDKKRKNNENQLKIFLLPRDEDDDKNAIVEIRAGTGGLEASLFCSDLFKMYEKVCSKKKWQLEIINISKSEAGGFKEVIFSVNGNDIYSYLKYESGVHRVQRIPETETQGRVHTSAATVAVLPEAEEVDIKIKESDLRIDVFRAGGPGGQSVNTTDSAVRVTHLPSGVVVSQQDEKSQHKNKAKALKILRSRVYEAEKRKKDLERSSNRRSQIGTGDRSERIRTYNFPQGRVTDHRINLTLHKLDEFLSGEIHEEMNEQLRLKEQDLKLEGLK